LVSTPPQRRPVSGHPTGRVVGPGVEGLDLVPLAILGGEHEDRCPVALLAQGGADPVAVDTGEQDVQHDRVERVLASHPQPVGAVVDHVDGESLRLQAVAQTRGQPLLVLDHEHPHPLILADPG
jgi:hypothetical protein